MKLKQAVIIGYFGQTKDRFAVYHQPLTTHEKLDKLAAVDGITGAEIVFPYELADISDVNRYMSELGIAWAAVNANIKAEPQFLASSASSNRPKVRKSAVDMIRKAKDCAREVGAPLVTCCPLSDGYDYLFQVDYALAWKNLVETFSEAADYHPEIPLCIEYKFSEMRVHCHIDTAAKALLLCREAANKSLGVTIDFGHAIYGHENPAQALCLVAESGVPWYLHTNDNDGRFDWDMIGASRHFLDYVEFLFYAQEYGYDQYLTTDASPRTLDPIETFRRHASMTAGVWHLCENLDRTSLRRLMREENSEKLLEVVQRDILRI